VKGMLPSTTLGRELFRHLKVYAGPSHPHQAQVRAGNGKARTQGTQRAQARAESSTAETASGPAATSETTE
jgi:hypothetical protein